MAMALLSARGMAPLFGQHHQISHHQSFTHVSNRSGKSRYNFDITMLVIGQPPLHYKFIVSSCNRVDIDAIEDHLNIDMVQLLRFMTFVYNHLANKLSWSA
jgi:hypothetical protein